MKVIRLTYRDNDVYPNLYLMLFFRFAGIYVYERFFGPKKVGLDDIKVLAEDGKYIPVFSDYDSEIYIVGTERDLLEYASLAGNKARSEVVISLNEELPGMPQGAIAYNKGQELGLLNQLISRLREQRVILPDQAGELNALARIYDNNHIARLTLCAKYFFTAIDKEQAVQYTGDYERILNDLVTELVNNGCGWGDRHLMYIQYAALQTIYELNYFCLRYKLPLAYNRDTLIRLCDTLEDSFSGFLGDSVMMLKGQIYDDLFFEPNKAYERYVRCCSEKTAYNAYVFYRKGLYWQNFANDFTSAIKYYLNAVCIYPEYYRVWFKIGFCYQKLERYKEAVASYENVKKCLVERMTAQCVRPMEIEHIFKSQLQIAYIREKNGDLYSAIEAAKIAERVWDMIGSTSFFEFMCEADESEKESYRKKTRDSLDIRWIYEKLAQWYGLMGMREEATIYRDKQKRWKEGEPV